MSETPARITNRRHRVPWRNHLPVRGELALLAFGIVAAVLVGEGVARLLAAGRHAGAYAPFNTRRHPGASNSLGYRDVEHRTAKAPGTRRVVVLGDSFTWGVKVDYDDAWPQRLGRMLTLRRGEAWEVVSLARPGMNTVEEAEQLATEGLAYDPDVVVLGYCLNDSEGEDAAEVRRARDWEEWTRDRARRDKRVLNHSALYRLAADRLRAWRENRLRIRAYRSQYAADYRGWIAGKAALGRMAGLCRERRTPLVVMVFPLFGNPLGDRYPFTAVHATIVQAIAATDWARPLDLLPAFRDLEWHYLVVDGANDEHPNEIAHRIAAQTLASALTDVLPPSATPGDPPVSALQRSPSTSAGLRADHSTASAGRGPCNYSSTAPPAVRVNRRVSCVRTSLTFCDNPALNARCD